MQQRYRPVIGASGCQAPGWPVSQAKIPYNSPKPSKAFQLFSSAMIVMVRSMLCTHHADQKTHDTSRLQDGLVMAQPEDWYSTIRNTLRSGNSRTVPYCPIEGGSSTPS